MAVLTLRRGNGERLDDGRWVWGATVDIGVPGHLPETAVIVPAEMMVLLRRQLDAPRNADVSLEDLVEGAARKATIAREWRNGINLTNEDLTF